MKLISYIRVSTEGQLDGYGAPSQAHDIEQFAARDGHELVVELTDAFTGKDVERPEFENALSMIEAGEAEGILVAKFDRLARKLVTQEALLALVWKAGGRVFSADSGEILQDDPDDPMRTAMRQMIGVMAEFDRTNTVSRLRKGREAKARTGKYAGGGIPYGQRHDRETDTVVTDEDETRIIRLARSWFEDEPNLSAVARRLNREGFTTRTGAQWSAVQVRRVLGRA